MASHWAAFFGRTLSWLLVTWLAAGVLVGCAAPTGAPDPNMANPASVHCEEAGGTLEIRTAADGSQSGYCHFENGAECEEWAFLRGACSPDGMGDALRLANPASTYCVEQGGTLELRTDDNGDEFGMCLLDDGTACEEWAFLRGECGPAGP